MIDRSEFIDQPAPMAEVATPGVEPASPRVTRKRAADLAMTPEGMVSGSLESERAKVQRLLGHAQELEAMVDAPFDPTAAGILVPDVVTRPDKEGGGGARKRLTAMHGSVTMQGVGEEAEQREREATEQAAAAKAKKLQAAEKKEVAAAAILERDAEFALCEVACACGDRGHPVPVYQVEAVPGMRSQERPLQGQGVRGCTQAAPAGIHAAGGTVGGAQGGWGAVRTTWLFCEPREIV